MTKHTSRKITAFNLFGAAVGIFGFFIPAVSVIVYVILVKRFLPSGRLVTISEFLSSAVAVLFLVVLTPQQVARFKAASESGDLGKQAKSLIMFFIVPAFGFFMFHMFLTMPVTYVLHVWSTSQQVVRIEKVTVVPFSLRSCNRALELEGSTFLMPQRICGIAPDLYGAIKRGGTLKVEGLASKYGITVQQYQVVPSSG